MVESQTRKVIDLYETMLVRHGVMLVGPTGGGKTTVYRTLAKTCDNLHAEGLHKENAFYMPVHIFVMNPKSITMGELYGEIDKLTLEWKDGLMGLTVRHCVNVSHKNICLIFSSHFSILSNVLLKFTVSAFVLGHN